MTAICMMSMSVPANADWGYAKKDINDRYAYTQYDCEFWSESGFWDVSWGADGVSKTVWLGNKPVKADSIKHNDILRCVSGHTVTYTYVVSNTWRVVCNFSYEHTGLLAAWNYSMDTKGTIQFGSNFYDVRTK